MLDSSLAKKRIPRVLAYAAVPGVVSPRRAIRELADILLGDLQPVGWPELVSGPLTKLLDPGDLCPLHGWRLRLGQGGGLREQPQTASGA